MKPSVEEIGNLLALKRHERPPEGYMDDFLREFHQRRREDAVAKKGFGTWWTRFTEWIAEPGTTKWAYGAGMAYAAIVAAVVIMPRGDEAGSNTMEIDHQVIVPTADALPAQQLEELDTRPSSEGAVGEREF